MILRFCVETNELKQVPMEFGEFMEVARYASQGKIHFLSKEPSLSYYLCQCPIFSNLRDVPEVLPQLQHDVDIPCMNTIKITMLFWKLSCNFFIVFVAFLRGDTLERINLWIGAGPTKTNLHYDSSHNILTVLQGCKEVWLYPPGAACNCPGGFQARYGTCLQTVHTNIFFSLQVTMVSGK